MIHPYRVGLSVFVIAALLAAPAWAQIGTLGPLKTSPNVDADGEKAINTFVGDQFKKLGSATNSDISRARNQLVDESRNPLGNVSPDYASKYAAAVNKSAVEFLTNSKSPRARLNAAIVIARVSDSSQNTRLEEATLLLLDPAQPIPMKVWGLRSARGLVASLVALNRQQKIVDAILKTVKQSPGAGIIQDAYDALTPAADKTVAKAVLDPLMDLAEYRIGLYQKGTPDDPGADGAPFGYFMQNIVWDQVMTPRQQLRAMQLVCNLLVASAHRAEEPLNRGVREQITAAIERIGGAVYVAGQLMKAPELAAAAQALAKAADNNQANLMLQVDPVINEIRKLQGFAPIVIPQKPSPAAAGLAGGIGLRAA